MIVGGSSAYVGAAYVGSLDGYFFTSTGELVFSGAATFSRHENRTASGEITYSGEVPLQVTKATLGEVTYEGGFGYKQYTRTQLGYITFNGAALYDFNTTHRFYFGTGDITFEGTAPYSIGYQPTATGEITFESAALVAKKVTKFTSGQILFDSSAIRTKSKQFTTVSGELDLFGIVSTNSNRSGAAVWYSSNPDASIGTSDGDSSVWEETVPVEPEDGYVPVSVWSETASIGGTIVGGGRVW